MSESAENDAPDDWLLAELRSAAEDVATVPEWARIARVIPPAETEDA